MVKKTTPTGDSAASKLPAKRRKKKDTALSPQHEDPQWQALEAKLGGRDGLLAAARASKNPKATMFMELMLDPAFRRHGTKDLAKKAGLTVPEIVDIYRDLRWMETTIALHERLPEIIEGAAQDATPSFVPCPECKGTKHAENGDACWYCRGAGEIRKSGDKDKLKFIGDAVGLTGKSEPMFQNNIQINNPAQSTSFEEMVRRASVQTRPMLVEAKSVREDDSDTK